MGKMLFRIMLIGALFLCFSLPYTGKMSAQSIAPSSPFLKINNYYVLFTAPKAPYIDQNNRYMVPLRSINDLLGDRLRLTQLLIRPQLSLEHTRLSLK